MDQLMIIKEGFLISCFYCLVKCLKLEILLLLIDTLHLKTFSFRNDPQIKTPDYSHKQVILKTTQDQKHITTNFSTETDSLTTNPYGAFMKYTVQ